MPMKIEKLALENSDELLALIEQYYAFDGIHFDADAVRKGIPLLLKDTTYGAAFFVNMEGSRAGYFIVTFGFDLEFGGRIATLTDFFLYPDYRGKGYGRDILAFMERFCRDNGIQALELQVERHNPRAQHLYRAFGFQELDRIPMSKAL